MQIPVSVVIAIVSLSWSAGIFVGLFTARFVGKKDCKVYRQEIEREWKEDTSLLWKRVDAIQDSMTGGKMQFEVRLMPKSNA